MGIPKYFREITKKNSDLIFDVSDIDVNIDNLYLDMNCLIHPCCKMCESEYQILLKSHNSEIVLNKYKQNINYISSFEKKIFNCIEIHLNKIFNYAKPCKSIYLSIDGVAPRAKMEQQRLRRYRSVMVNGIKNNILKKHNINKEVFDSNCITPGTIFMHKLSKFLKSYLEQKFKELNISLYLDDSSLIGEGEHKILQHIKNNNKEDINCIYGLDADLIMLSLVSDSKVYLLRESVHFGKVDMDKLLLFDVDKFSLYLFEDIKSLINLDNADNNTEEIEKDKIIKDYIALCFFIGNDFLPKLIGLDINNNSIDVLLKIYTDIFSIRRKYLINNNNTINFVFVKQIFSSLFNIENNYVIKYQSYIDNFKPRLNAHSKLDIELEKLNFYPIFNKNNSIKLNDSNWRNNYYQYYFNINNPIKNKDFINSICTNYIEGLQWNIKYYLDECVCYSWYYMYRAAPLLKDLCLYLIDRVYPHQFEDIRYNPLEQLSIVLPIENSYLWCNEFVELLKHDIELQQYYPTGFKLDTLHNKFIHECEPILNNIDSKFIKDKISKCKLNSIEKILVKPGTLFGIEKSNIKLLINES